MKLIFYAPVLIFFGTVYSQNGKSEFADYIVAAFYSNANKNFSSFYGGTRWEFPILINPDVILGENNTYFVSLPKGSYIIVEFIDNYIIDFPNQDDILISEIGCSGERAEVFVSSDGIKFFNLGIVDDCSKSTLDLGSINFKSPVKFIKIVGMDSRGGSPGFDLSNIRGLPKSNIPINLNSPTITSIKQQPLPIVDKMIISGTILFSTNSAELNATSQEELSFLFNQLNKYPEVDIVLFGHTDHVGNQVSNLNLSIRRAQSVVDFLIMKGIAKDRITFSGKGEIEPLNNNTTEEEKKMNRRVEFEFK